MAEYKYERKAKHECPRCGRVEETDEDIADHIRACGTDLVSKYTIESKVATVTVLSLLHRASGCDVMCVWCAVLQTPTKGAQPKLVRSFGDSDAFSGFMFDVQCDTEERLWVSDGSFVKVFSADGKKLFNVGAETGVGKITSAVAVAFDTTSSSTSGNGDIFISDHPGQRVVVCNADRTTYRK